MQHGEVAEEKAYSELPVRLDTEQQEKDQRRNIQQIKVIKDKNENVVTNKGSVLRKQLEHMKLMNVENETETKKVRKCRGLVRRKWRQL